MSILQMIIWRSKRALYFNVWKIGEIMSIDHSTVLRLSSVVTSSGASCCWGCPVGTNSGTSSCWACPVLETRSLRTCCCLGPSCWMISGRRSLMVLVSGSPEIMKVFDWIAANAELNGDYPQGVRSAWLCCHPWRNWFLRHPKAAHWFSSPIAWSLYRSIPMMMGVLPETCSRP